MSMLARIIHEGRKDLTRKTRGADGRLPEAVAGAKRIRRIRRYRNEPLPHQERCRASTLRSILELAREKGDVPMGDQKCQPPDRVIDVSRRRADLVREGQF